MLTTNVIQRTFFVRFGNSTGTAFTIDIDDRQYLITARHVVEGIGQIDQIEVYHYSSWRAVPVQTVGLGAPNSIDNDIAVLAASQQLSPTYTLTPNAGQLVWGQRVFFAGFPYGLHTETQISNGFPVPIIKGATMSGILPSNAAAEVFLLDGHNNPGFSGGPAVFKPSENAGAEFKVLGVISAYKTEDTPITLRGQPTELVSKANTGIIVCPSIKQATDMIEDNPIGFELPD